MRILEWWRRSPSIDRAFNVGIVGWFIVVVVGLGEWAEENLGWFEWFAVMSGSALLYFAVMRTLRLIYAQIKGEEEPELDLPNRHNLIEWVVVVVVGGIAGALVALLGSLIGD